MRQWKQMGQSVIKVVQLRVFFAVTYQLRWDPDWIGVVSYICSNTKKNNTKNVLNKSSIKNENETQ